MKIGRFLITGFSFVFVFLHAILLVICMTGTHHNVLWYKELFVSIVMLIGITGMFCLLKRSEPWLEKHEKSILLIFYCLWALLLYGFSCWTRGEITHDYLSVYESAVRYASGQEVDWSYLARWRNNFPSFLVIAVLTKISLGLGAEDSFYIILAVNVLMVLWTGRCIYILAGKLYDGKWVRFAALLLFVMFIPVWGGTHIFYSDTFSLCFGVWGTCLFLNAENRAVKAICAGAVWAAGYSVKATSGIAMIAIFLIFLLTGEWKKSKKIMAASVLAFIAVNVGIQLIHQQFPSYALEESKAPIEYWVAIGMHGNGSYGENEELALQILEIPGVEEKKAFLHQYILENKEQFWDLPHLVSKARYNFASGMIGLSGNNSDAENWGYQFFNDFGTFGGYMTIVTTGYFYALFTLGGIGAVFLLRELLKGELKANIMLVTQLTIFGLILFLMVWEANNRQLYNHIPWFALWAAGGGYYFCTFSKDMHKIVHHEK